MNLVLNWIIELLFIAPIAAACILALLTMDGGYAPSDTFQVDEENWLESSSSLVF
jgi:hypothetical protein